jgi:hypothetical protein
VGSDPIDKVSSPFLPNTKACVVAAAISDAMKISPPHSIPVAAEDRMAHPIGLLHRNG